MADLFKLRLTQLPVGASRPYPALFMSLSLLYFVPPKPALLMNAQIARESGHFGLAG
jgi:hypothetical protein